MDHNRSWNCGVEGPTDDPQVTELRERQKRNFLATLVLSQGVPMLLAGDEFGRTQGGNNNAYCQDNELSWIDWHLPEKNDDLLQFVRLLITLRRDHSVFRRRHFFRGRSSKNGGIEGISWFNSSGTEISVEEWTSGRLHHLGMLMDGESIDEYDKRGRLIEDDNFLLLLNGGNETIEFNLQFMPEEPPWQLVLDTALGHDDNGQDEMVWLADPYTLKSHSLVLLVQQKNNQK
jgi:isoamylase